MKASDYIVKFIESLGVKHIFAITGGAVVHFMDSIGRNPNVNYVCTEHEQAAAMAAEAYSKITGNIGVAVATSGPGAINLMTGIACAYFDSTPTIYFTGQVQVKELRAEREVRQFGFQEADIIDIAKPITKMAIQIKDEKDIRYILEKAVYVAKNGRPGPVLIDLPFNMQTAEINPDELRSFDPSELQNEESYQQEADSELDAKANEIVNLIRQSKRPLLVLGGGIKIAKAEQEAEEFIKKLDTPFTLTWGAMDLCPFEYPLFTGGFGVSTTRSGNFAVQNADFVLSIGARLDSREMGSRPEIFAREAKKIVLDLDQAELNKYDDKINYDMKIKADAKRFLQILNQKISQIGQLDISEWKRRCSEWKAKYPICLPKYYNKKDYVDPYVFMQILSQKSKDDEIIITDAGGNLSWTMQSYPVKAKQKLFSAFGHSPMGYSFPASIGASFASGKGQVVCIIGDGGLQMNIQELQTIVYHRLPIKIFLFNNRSYGMIKQFQDVLMESRYQATTPETGYSFPNFIKVAQAYGIKTENIRNNKELAEKIEKVLAMNEPVLCNVDLDFNQKVIPKSKFGKPIEDLAPLIPREEFLKEMIVKPLPESLEEEKDAISNNQQGH